VLQADNLYEAYREHEVMCCPPSDSKIGIYVAYLAGEHVDGRENASKRVGCPPRASARVPPTYCGAMDMLPSFRVVLLHASVSTGVHA
jgi:hypothetical protein